MDKRKSEVRILSNSYNAPKPTITHHRKTQKSMNFEHFQLENPKSSTLQDESKTHTPKFKKFGQINAALYILDACMHQIHTDVT